MRRCDKETLRKEMRAKRGALPESEAAALSLAAQRHIVADPIWRNAGSVGLYLPVRKELDTGCLCASAWEEGKRVLLPHTLSLSEGVMHFYPYVRGQVLRKSRYGIPEPDPGECPPPPGGEWIPEVLIVPGVAFDRKGFRLGAGGGYYDRFCVKPSMRKTVRIGLAYSLQILEALPVEEWDTSMHAIATEKGLIWL